MSDAKQGSVCFLDDVLDSTLVYVTGAFPGNVLAGNAVLVSKAAVELSLEYLAEIGCADGNGDILAAVNSLLHCIEDSVYAVVSGCAELVKSRCSVLLNVLIDEFLSGTLGSLGVK